MGKWIKVNIIPLILAVIGIGFFVYYLNIAFSWVLYPHSIDFGEGFVLNYAKLWANGTWNWDITTPPYMTMVYGVGYPILMQPLINMFGVNLWVARALSFALALGVCVVIYFIVYSVTRKHIYALVASLLPATQPIFRDWSAMARVDMIAVWFELYAFCVFLYCKDSKWCYVSIPIFILAMLVKLTAIAGLIAVVIYLLVVNRKRALKFIVLTFAGTMVWFIPLMIVSNGLYWKHIFLYQNTIQNFDIPVFMVNFNMFFYAFVPLFFLSLVYLRRYISKGKISLIGLFFIVAVVLNMALSFRPGAAGLYYYEAIIAGCIAGTLALYYLLKHGKMQTAVISTVFLVVFAVICALQTDMPMPDGKYGDDISRVQGIIKDTDKPIVTENPEVVMSAGKELYIETFIFTNLARLGYWDETPYIKEYESQYFDYVLLKVSLEQKEKYVAMGYPDGHFTNRAMQAIEDNYTLVYSNEPPDAYTNPRYDWRGYLNLYEANNRIGK